MNQLEEESALYILSNIPSTTQYDRLCIQEDGTFSVDMSHIYIGRMGRTIMNTVIGGYNRRTVLNAIESLVRNLTHISNTCMITLNNPYARGNLRTYGFQTKDTQRYSGYLQQLKDKVCNLYLLITTLKLAYIADRTSCKLLDDVNCDIQTIYQIIDPMKHIV